MKIVHVYAQNLEIFEKALEGTGCHINGSRNLDYMQKSLTAYNSRDVMGMIVFRSPMTKKTLKLIKVFDALNVFKPMPIIVICDNATTLCQVGKIKVKNSQLYAVDSFESTISDVDIQHIFATLSCASGEMYDLSSIEAADGSALKAVTGESVKSKEKGALALEVLSECARLGGTKIYAGTCEESVERKQEGLEVKQGAGGQRG